jgi:hypothetical protein
MKHKKILVGVATATLVGISSPAIAVSISNLNGQTCGSGVGTWHFVNNQTGGATTAGILTVSFSDGTNVQVTADKIVQNTQHFNVTAGGDLLSASTNLNGKLVLSDFTCEAGPKK